MERATGIETILIALAALSSVGATSYYARCVTDPRVGARILYTGKVEGQPIRCHIGCTRQLSPVCGSDGTTYGNECALCAEACWDSALYRVCRGSCPCSMVDVMATPTSTANVTTAGLGPGEKGALTANRLAQEPQDLAGQYSSGKHESPIPDGRGRASPVRTTRPRKLKNRGPVAVITHTELSIVSGEVTANALNQVTLDLRAELAAPENDSGASGHSPDRTVAVEVYRKVKGRPVGKLDLVGRPVRATNRSGSLLGSGRAVLHIRGLRYPLDLHDSSCRHAGKVCVRLRPGTRGSHTRVRGRPSRKVLRSCARLRCRADERGRGQLYT